MLSPKPWFKLSLQASRFIEGTVLQGRESCGPLSSLKASEGTTSIPLLSQMTRDRECFITSALWSCVNTPGLSHQNLQHTGSESQ